ncbi:hypothetical protein O181_068495 [Austropuccinia psidii MF-1]|uniref:Uncharacterized protein n=1 Tax=Austropuccinia psidii MF-1 TaxID=1389203 RepID=A0A9Q3ESM7_9BASI|nr:hypothetical protein [Austropuccinia psidii MF-1]
MPYLNAETCRWIVGMRQASLPFQAISNLAGVPLTTVYETMKKYKHFGTVQTEKKTRNPPITTAQDRQELDRIIAQGRCLTVAQVTDLLTHQVSTWTIQHKTHKLGQSGLCLEDTSREVATGKPCGQPFIRSPDAHGMGCFLRSNASTFGLSQRLNDIGRDGAASLLTTPAPVHSLDGAGALDTWSPAHLTDGG